jgi:hypothetical protein
MKTLRQVLRLALLLGCANLSPHNAQAAEASTQAGKESSAPAEDGLIAVTAKDETWVKQAKAAYPLSECVVSGEQLGSAPDEMYDFIYRQKGKPDRLISFCCEGCSKDFTIEPARFMAKLDEAAAAKK